ncbi:MAG: SymE family type I addiction module toxin [Balneolaceae bacterium]
MATTRRIKLQPKLRAAAWGKRNIVPELRMSGHWLARHGFAAGSQVQIIVKQNQLIIKPVAG